jgi:CRP-like cAMP-binding protein/Zn-dependent protease
MWRRGAVLMDQSSQDDTLVGVGPPGRAPGGAVSRQSSRDKHRTLSPRARHDRTVGPSVASEWEGRAISVAQARPGIWGALAQEAEQTPPPEDGQADLWGHLSEMVDPAQLRPKLAPDIEIKEFKLRWGNDYAMVANPRDLVHYQIQPSDVELLQMMDGTRTLKEIVFERFKESGDLELSGVADLVKQLYEGNFFEQRYLDADAALKHAINPVTPGREKVREFATSLSIEWTGADGLVRWFYDHGFSLFFNPVVAVVCALTALVGFGLFVDTAQSHRFGLSGESLALGFMILIGLDYVLTFAHELGHALVLIRHGRRVKSAGFMIYFGSPAFFVESADGLMLERGERIQQAFAGAFAELILAGIASILVFIFPGARLSPTMYKFAVLNYLVIFLNLVPFLELDGYFILADLIQVPDLRPRSLTFLRHDLWHKLRVRQKFNKQEIGLGLYAVVGLLFTVVALYSSFFFWRSLFGGLVSRLWHGGLITRILLVALALFLAGPLIRGAINLLRSLARRLRAMWRQVQFRLETKWRVEAATLIDSLPLFDDVPEDVLSELAGRVRLKTVSRGQPVVRQGERAEAFYVVRKGTFQVVEEDPENGTERQLRLLGRGEGFGEVGLAEGSSRTATVRAIEEGEVFEVDKGTFDQLLADMVHVPDFAPTLQAVAELREMKGFSHLEADVLSELLQLGGWVSFTPGETVFEQGDPADGFYAIRSGQVEVFEDGKLVRTLGAGSYFGEIALLFEVPRTATVRAKTAVRAFRLDREGFDRVVAESFRKGTLNPYISPDRTWQH